MHFVVYVIKTSAAFSKRPQREICHAHPTTTEKHLILVLNK